MKKTLIAMDFKNVRPSLSKRIGARLLGGKYIFSEKHQLWILKRKVTGEVNEDGWFYPYKNQWVTYRIRWPFGIKNER